MLGLVSATSFARAACHNTANSRIDDVTGSLFPTILKNDDHKVIKIKSDSVLGLRWAIISNCSHPEWPEFALPLTEKGLTKPPQETATSSSEDAKTFSVVHAGDIVQLWKQESLLRIEVSGVSEESGGLGKTVRVRLLHRRPDDQSAPEHLFGVVRGPFNVEIQRQ
jgi:hypothetical protein